MKQYKQIKQADQAVRRSSTILFDVVLTWLHVVLLKTQTRHPPPPVDNSLFGAAYFATYVTGPWHMLDVSPAMRAHGASMPLTMFVVRDVACRMRRLRTADKDDGYTAGRGCFPKAWEPTGGGGGLCAVE